MSLSSTPFDNRIYEATKQRLIKMVRSGSTRDITASEIMKLTHFPYEEVQCALEDLAVSGWFKTKYVAVDKALDGHSHASLVEEKFWEKPATRDGIEVICSDCKIHFTATPENTYVSYTPLQPHF